MTTDDLAMSIRELADRTAITDCLHRYARGMDRLDRDLARSAYHDDAIDDHVGFVGDVDGFLDWAFAYHAGQARHHHYISNIHIELDGDEAHVESYFMFVGTEASDGVPLTVFGGRYVDRFERRDRRWAIAARICVPEWSTAPESLMPADGSGPDIVGTISRDRNDVSYLRPLTVTRTMEEID